MLVEVEHWVIAYAVVTKIVVVDVTFVEPLMLVVDGRCYSMSSAYCFSSIFFFLAHR